MGHNLFQRQGAAALLQSNDVESNCRHSPASVDTPSVGYAYPDSTRGEGVGADDGGVRQNARRYTAYLQDLWVIDQHKLQAADIGGPCHMYRHVHGSGRR